MTSHGFLKNCADGSAWGVRGKNKFSASVKIYVA